MSVFEARCNFFTERLQKLIIRLGCRVPEVLGNDALEAAIFPHLFRHRVQHDRLAEVSRPDHRQMLRCRLGEITAHAIEGPLSADAWNGGGALARFPKSTPFARHILDVGRECYAPFVLGNARALADGVKAFVANVYGEVQRTRGAAERLVDFFNEQPEPPEKSQPPLVVQSRYRTQAGRGTPA